MHRSGRVANDSLTAGAVARRLGVAVTTLRTWHQRYGLGPSHHVPGQHRRYTPEDMERLEVMRRLTAQGVAPAEAAAWARRVPIPIDLPAAGAGARPQAESELPEESAAGHRPVEGETSGKFSTGNPESGRSSRDDARPAPPTPG